MNRVDPTDGGRTVGFVTAWWAMALFIVASLVSFMDRIALSLLIDPIRAELHLTEVQMGLLQGSAFSLVYALAALPLGRIADRHSRRNLLVVGIALWSAATAFGGFAPNFEWLFVARVLVGVGEASLVPAVMSMISDMHGPQGRGRGVAVFMMGQSLGGGASMALVGFVTGLSAAGAFAALPVVGGLSTWRTVLVFCGLVGVPVVLLLLTVREPPRTGVNLRASTPREARVAALRYITSRKALFGSFYCGYAFMVLGSYGLVAWAPVMLMRRHGLSPGEVGALFGSVTAVTQVAGVLLGGALLQWLERRGERMRKVSLARWTAACCAPAALVAFAPGPYVAAALLAFWFLFSSMTSVLLVATNLDLYPGNLRGTATALSSLVTTMIGASLGPLAIALLTERLLGDPARVDVSIGVVLAATLTAALVLLGSTARRLRDRLVTDAELAEVAGVGAGDSARRAASGSDPCRAEVTRESPRAAAVP